MFRFLGLGFSVKGLVFWMKGLRFAIKGSLRVSGHCSIIISPVATVNLFRAVYSQSSCSQQDD